MKLRVCCLAVALAASLTSAWGQGAPHVGYLYPAGGQQGTTFTVVAGGQALRGADDVVITGDGVRASVVEYVRPLDNQELRTVRGFLGDLVRRRWCVSAMDAAAKQATGEPALPDHPWLRDLDEKSPRELDRLWVQLFDPKKQPNAQIAEQAVLEVTIDGDALPGDRELRLVTPAGLSNPLCFQVGALPEVCEEDFAGPGDAPPVADLPVLLNGQIMPGEVDRFGLRARSGQRLVVRVQARRLIPYLADAVPGWFQATVALRDPSGAEVAYRDDYHFDPDPVLLYQVPTDGVYELEIRDAIYRGRDDFVYRIAVGELPFVTQAFPLGGEAGASAVASLAGWNLPTESLALDTSPGGVAIRRAAVGPEGLGGELRYAVDALPGLTEAEPNDADDKAQTIVVPSAVNGRVGQPGDVDLFSFAGRAGEEIVAEVYARRLGSPLDSALRLLDPSGGVVALNDDHKDPEMGLVTHHADSYLRAQLPADGTYRVCVSDAQRQGGDAYSYRLQLRAPRPDFALRLVPSSVNVPAGRTATVTVHAIRKDGFAGEIDVVLTDAPEGFALSAARIPADADSVEAKISAPRGSPRQVVPLHLEGRAQMDGVQVSRPAVPAEDMMQAFLWRFIVPQQELMVAVTGARPVPAVWRPLLPGVRLASSALTQVPLGGTAAVRVEAPQTLEDRGQTALEAVRFRLSSSPRGVTLRAATVGPTGVALTLKADANLALAGDSGYLIIEAFTDPQDEGADNRQAARTQRVSLGVLPAIAFQVVQP